MVDKKITNLEWSRVAEYIKNELAERKNNKYRKKAELRWKEVDRQIYMDEMEKISQDGQNDGRSAIELGELSRASEVLSADVRRLSFPQNRSWFDVHANITGDLDEETGQLVKEAKIQKRIDGQVRALMTQQHLDFGLKARVDLSVKEALHHGSYVVEVDILDLLGVSGGTKVKRIKAPVWIPHSMWNSYPETTTDTYGQNMFYSGSMIIESFDKYKNIEEKYKNLKSGTVFFDNIKKLSKEKDEIRIITFFGDIYVNKGSKKIFLPNCKVKVAKDYIIYYEPNKFEFPQIIYNGWEKLDVRDPYFISPLIKMSPTQKVASILSNVFVDNVDRWAMPPIEYDANDPEYKINGPDLSPGAKNARQGSNPINELKIGDPNVALQGTQFFIDQLQKGTSVDSVRSGMTASVEQTATEVERTRQSGQIRTIDFVDKHELHGLRPFLYIQHKLNKEALKEYTFYNPEVDSPDFERLTSADIPDEVHFEVVGSRGLIEEEQRTTGLLQITQFLLSNPKTENLPKMDEIAKNLYQSVGVKNPELIMNIENDQIQMVIQQAQMQMDELNQQIQVLSDELMKNKFKDEEHSLELEQKELEKEQKDTRIAALQAVITFLNEHMALGKHEQSISKKPS